MSNNSIIHYKYNFFYVTLILLIAILLLLTIKWASLPDLLDYILFSLAITSITLSVITIIFSIYSNFSLGKNLDSINNASEDLRKSTIDLESSMDIVNTNILNIPKNILEMGKNIQEGIEPAIESAMQKLQNVSKIEVKDAKEKSTHINKEFLERFFKRNSFNGVVISFCSFLANKYKVSLNLAEIENIIETPQDYSRGQLVAQDSIGFFKSERKGEEFIISDFNKELEKLFPKIFQDEINNFIKRNTDKDWMEGLEDSFKNYENDLVELFENKK